MSSAKKRLLALAKRNGTTKINRSGTDPVKRLEKLLNKPINNALATRDSSVRLYMLADRTASMYHTIETVRDNVQRIAKKLFEGGTRTELAVWGLEDHFVAGNIYGEGRIGVDKNPLVSDPYSLRSQLKSLKCASNNIDLPENYECGWNELAKELERSGRYDGKTAVITFMETAAHGQLHTDTIYDGGCPFNVDWRKALGRLKKDVDQFFLVDCDSGDSKREVYYKKAKQSCVNVSRSDEHYIKLGQSSNLIPDLITAAGEKTRSREAYQKFIHERATIS